MIGKEITLGKKFTYHFYEEKVKFISDETLSIKGRLLYLSAILFFLSNYLEFKISSVFGIRFGDNQYIEMSYVAYFLLASVLYNLFSFRHKYSEDRISQVKIEKNYSSQEIGDAKAKGELIQDQVFNFSELEKYKPPSAESYKEALDSFEKNIDEKLNSFFEKCKDTLQHYELDHSYKLIDELSFISVNVSENPLFDKHRKNYVALARYKHTISSIENDVDKILRELKDECLKKLDVCLDPEIFREELKIKEENFQKSIEDLQLALNRRSVKVNKKHFINYTIPLGCSLVSMCWVIINLICFYLKDIFDYNLLIGSGSFYFLSGLVSSF